MVIGTACFISKGPCYPSRANASGWAWGLLGDNYAQSTWAPIRRAGVRAEEALVKCPQIFHRATVTAVVQKRRCVGASLIDAPIEEQLFCEAIRENS